MFLERLYEKRKHIDLKENRAGISMAIIPFLGFLIFGLGPIFLGVVMSFFDFGGQRFFRSGTNDLGDPYFKFVGFSNYSSIFTYGFGKNVAVNGRQFLQTLYSTVIMYVSVPACIVLSLLVAFFLSKKIKCKTLFRTIYLLPFVCSSIAISLIWGRFFKQGGVLSQLLQKHFAMQVASVDWVGQYFYWVLFLVHVWGGCGFNIILYTAALTNVNNSYYEAAQVDGANPFQIFFKITLPSISPTTFYLFITSTIGAMQAYAVPDMVGKYSNAEAGKVFGIQVDEQSLTVIGYVQRLINGGDTQVGVAAAIAVVLSAIIGVITIINFLGQKYWVSYD